MLIGTLPLFELIQFRFLVSRLSDLLGWGFLCWPPRSLNIFSCFPLQEFTPSLFFCLERAGSFETCFCFPGFGPGWTVEAATREGPRPPPHLPLWEKERKPRWFSLVTWYCLRVGVCTIARLVLSLCPLETLWVDSGIRKAVRR